MTVPLEFLKPSEVATKLRVAPMTAYRLISSGDLRATRVGRSIRIRVSDADAFVRDNTSGGWAEDE